MLDLEKALQRRCAADPQYETLFAQWTFDKQLVGRALQTIPLLFPHYSLHDASHADTILRQMARVLGPRRIERLSPTDLWLLLEAAYHHDLGMVVSNETMRAWWGDNKFDAFLDGLKSHADDDVRRAAELLDKKSEVRPQGESWPFDVHRALVLVMAEYARPRHPGQSRKYIDAPSLIDLKSPRTQLLPRRFWSLLGRICEIHGLGFAETMKLPARESGFAMDEAHPRFVACMLRLGDLLDLDDGRFCPVLARAFGGLPPSSKAHEEKHHSIEEFLVDASEIRVVAECTSPEAFDATEQWLTWLRNELRDQSVHWAEISPEKDFGAVPSAGRIEARLRDHLTFPDGRRPRFEVDKEAMLDFVRGAGLYNDETACIAELLQNAVDATLLRVWASNRKKWQQLHDQKDNQALEKLRKHLERYPIDVYVRRSKRVGAENHWSVVIRDRGAGISRDDIPYLQCVGSSRKNPRRMERMRGMPEWMKPAGFFGIGLQSAFLFTDRIVLRSRADDSMETIEIMMERRPGSNEPQILVRDVGGKKALTRPGTHVRFVLRELKVPKGYSYGVEYNETERVTMDYDPLLHDELPILPSKIMDATRHFASEALARVRLDGSCLERGVDDAGARRVTLFDPVNGIEFRLSMDEASRFGFLYRGRRTDEYFDRRLFRGVVVWHRDDASKILTVNREKIRVEARAIVVSAIDRALLNVLPRYYDLLKNDPNRVDDFRYLTLAIEVHKHMRNAGMLQHDEAWKSLRYERSSEITLADVLESERVRIVEDPAWYDGSPVLREPEILLSEDRREVKIQHVEIKSWLWDILRERYLVLQSAEPIHEGPYTGHAKVQWFVLREEPEDIIGGMGALKEIILSAANEYLRQSRRIIPCCRRFRMMALAKDAERELWHVAPIYERLVPRAIFPFCVKSDKKLSLDGVEELIRWTYEHRLDQAITEIDVARAVLDLVQVTDDILRAEGGEWIERIDYSVEDLRRRLQKEYGLTVLPIPVRPGNR